MDDWDVFFNPADFGRTAVWDTDAETVEIDGIFQAAHESVAPGEAAGVSTTVPVFTVAAEHVPDTWASGDDFELDAVNYRVLDVQPDGSGLARVILERA